MLSGRRFLSGLVGSDIVVGRGGEVPRAGPGFDAAGSVGIRGGKAEFLGAGFDEKGGAK